MPGREYVDVADPAATGPLGQITAKGLDDDGRAVVTVEQPGTNKDGVLRLYQSTVGTIRGSSFTPFQQPVGGPPRNAVYLDAQGPWTAWTETTSTDLNEFDWKVFLHDARTGRTRLLGDSADVAPVRPLAAVGETAPTVGTREVYWAATARRSRGEGFDELILAALVGAPGPVRRVVVGGYFPAADGTDLLYVSTARLDRNEAYAGRPPAPAPARYEIRRVREGTTSTVASGQLAGNQTISGLAARGGAIAYTVARPTTNLSTLVLIEPGGQRTDIRMHNGGGTSVCLTDRYLAFGSGSASGDAGQYVLERTGGRLWKVGEAPGRSLVLASPRGDYLAWTVQPSSPPAAYRTQLVRWTGGGPPPSER